MLRGFERPDRTALRPGAGEEPNGSEIDLVEILEGQALGKPPPADAGSLPDGS